MGDFDGDGLDDLAIVLRRDQSTEPLLDPAGSLVRWGPQTTTYLFYGRAESLVSGPLPEPSTYWVPGRGERLAGEIDVSGDGADDLVVSSRLWLPDEGCTLDMASLEPQLHIFRGTR